MRFGIRMSPHHPSSHWWFSVANCWDIGIPFCIACRPYTHADPRWASQVRSPHSAHCDAPKRPKGEKEESEGIYKYILFLIYLSIFLWVQDTNQYIPCNYFSCFPLSDKSLNSFDAFLIYLSLSHLPVKWVLWVHPMSTWVWILTVLSCSNEILQFKWMLLPACTVRLVGCPTRCTSSKCGPYLAMKKKWERTWATISENTNTHTHTHRKAHSYFVT